MLSQQINFFSKNLHEIEDFGIKEDKFKSLFRWCPIYTLSAIGNWLTGKSEILQNYQ